MRGRDACQHGHDKAEGRLHRAFHGAVRFGNDFMQGAGGQTAVRQMEIEFGEAEGQGAVDGFQARQQTAQFFQHQNAVSGAVSRHSGRKEKSCRVGH